MGIAPKLFAVTSTATPVAGEVNLGTISNVLSNVNDQTVLQAGGL